MPHAFKSVLLTGATSGIGLALARLLAEKNMDLIILTGRNEEVLRNLQGELSKNARIEIMPIDLKEREGRKKIAALIEEKTPDLVINNAGLGFYNKAIDNPIEDELLMVEVNIEALLEITLSAARRLVRLKKKGVILNVSSVAGEFPTPGMATYGATKAFVTSFSKAVDFELAPYGVRVLVSAPGQVATDFSKRASKKGEQKTKAAALALSPEKAAFYIWNQIVKRDPYTIFDYRNRWIVRLAKLLPENWVKNKIYNSIKQRL